MAKVTIELINNAATTLISSLKRLGYTCALRKVEVVIFVSSGLPPIEILRSQLIQKGHFFVSKDQPDTLLFYDHTMKGKTKKICAVDISYLDSPADHLIRDVNGLPFVAISYILLQKLREWAESPEKSSKRSRKQAELAAGVVLELLKADNLDIEPLDPSLLSTSRQHISRFMAQYSGYASAWEKLGFASALPVVKSPSLSWQIQPFELPSIPCSPEPEGFESPPLAEPTRIQMVIMAANHSVRLLSKCGWCSTVFGSLACFLYGNDRVPNDVDLLILGPSSGNMFTIEDLKQNLVVLDPYHFFTTPSQDEQATYRILWYRLTDGPIQTTKTSCKIDLLLPGVMNFPNFPPSLIHWDEGLPLIPFSLLLLQKLQAWDDHRRSKNAIEWQRQRTDMEDLVGLTGLSAFVPLTYSRPWSNTTLFSPEFQKLTKERVNDYCTLFPSSASAWRSLGFEV
ncbi:hypothetical protein J132_08708 [Termitomyces sp. J132]|nr:hypothetical protein J132_08708 [Termitomyces sp. J132]